MFTVKHVDSNGNETLHCEVAFVERIAAVQPTSADPLAQDQPGIKLTFKDGSGCHYGFSADPRLYRPDGPRIFVMNEHGATVAKYDL